MTLRQKTERSPLSPLVYCAAITIGMLVVGGGVFASRYHQMLEIELTAMRLVHLDGIILELDEAQTMSAQMAAATGDPKWEQRYRKSDEPLNAAIKEALSFAPTAASEAAQEAELADATLNAMDNRAFELSHQGNLAAASAVFDAAYEEQRRIYTNAMGVSMTAVSSALGDKIAAHRRTMLVAECLAAGTLVFLVLLWLHMLRLMRRYIRDRRDAESQLLGAHATLEARVEERTREVAASRAQFRVLVESIDAIPFEWDPATHRIFYIAPQAARLLECPIEALQDEALFGKVLYDEDRLRVHERIAMFVAAGNACTIDFRIVTNTRRIATVRMFLSARAPGQSSFGVMLDITNQMRQELEFQQLQKLESIGRLAAGVAHEINTPIQFVTDSVQFIRDSLTDVMTVVDKHRKSAQESLAGRPSAELARDAVTAENELDMPYLSEQMPKALDRSLEGLSRIATIVRSMKVFSHPDLKDKTPININESIASTLTIARNEYKYVADLETDFGDLPEVLCYGGELNQVLLNLVINAAHAISDAVANTKRRGRITVTTRRDGNEIEISVGDTGTGIPIAIRERVFDPFFTTKEVGKGTGQGLSHAHAVIVDKHHGTLTFDTTLDVGTTFSIRIPIDDVTPTKIAA